jgi:PKD domain
MGTHIGTGPRRVAAALMPLATVLAVTAVPAATASAAAAPGNTPACTDNWVGPTSGTSNWATSADWSAGVPNGTSTVACIEEAGTYTVQASANGGAGAAAVVVGGAASGTQTLQIDGINFPVTQSSEVLKGGVLSLTPTSSGDADISAGGTASLTIAHGGTLSSAGTAQAAQIGAAELVNKGTVTLAAATNVDNAGTTTDAGSFTIASGSTLSSGSFTHSAGKLTVDGTFNSANTFTQSGGTETGNPVVQGAGTFIDSAGTGSFIAKSATIEGTVPVGQTLTNLASSGNSTDTLGTASTAVTVDGTLACQTESSTICSFGAPDGGTAPGITVASGGTLETTGPGNSSAYVNLSANMDIEAGGTLTIANPATRVNVFTLTNSGTWQVTATGYVSIGGGADVTSTGTIRVTTGSGVTQPDGTILQSSGEFNNSGTLAVHTVGSEDISPDTPVITAQPGVGQFTSYSFGPDYYTVTYTPTEVELTTATPFTASATAFSPVQNEPITPKVASFTTHGESGTYSATVNYGDGSGVQPATVHLSGGHGRVTGPTHTYTATGTYTVTVVISTTAGTTKKVSEQVTVTSP